MLSHDQAQLRLKSFENQQHKQDQLKRIAALRGQLSFLGQVLLEAGPGWEKVAKDRDRAERTRREAGEQLGQLGSEDRQKLFSALFGKIAPQVEATWNLFSILPYQTHYSRRPFRRPTQYAPEARITWIMRLLNGTRGYDQAVTWFAIWVPYLSYWATDALGYLFAGAIDAGGETGQEVFDILIASANGSHEIGAMGRHVVRGLLCASRPDGWEYIERLLLAAQREEGLRQVILESVDEAHPQAFRRLLRLILDHNLSRFSATIRALNVWFGLALETVTQKTVNDLLTRVETFLNDPVERDKAIQGDSAQDAYYALWAFAFDDVLAALPRAIELRQSPDPERRFAATHLLAQMVLLGSFEELLKASEDPDLRVAARAVMNLNVNEYRQDFIQGSDLFERLEQLIKRLPHKENTLKPLVWDWFTLKLDRAELADRLVDCLGDRSPKRLIAYLPYMEPTGRSRTAKKFNEVGEKDSDTRDSLLKLAGDPSPQVRAEALAGLHGFRLVEKEILQIENLLTRHADDLRRGAIQLLLELPDAALLNSASRLLIQKNENQRQAGLELLKESVRANQQVEACRSLAAHYQERGTESETEKRVLDEILARDVLLYSLDDALGLMDPKNRTRPAAPQTQNLWGGLFKKCRLSSRAAVNILQALDELIESQRAESIEVVVGDTQRTELLGNVQYGFPLPNPVLPLKDDLERLPLRNLWESWWNSRPNTLRDDDGLELLRALMLSNIFQRKWGYVTQQTSEIPQPLQSHFEVPVDFKVKYDSLIPAILKWLIRANAIQNEVAFLLDALETSVGKLTKAELTEVKFEYLGSEVPARTIPSNKLAYLYICRWHRNIRPEAWKGEDHARVWKVARWLDEPKTGLPRYYPILEDALLGFQAGAATRDDILDLLLGARPLQRYGYSFRLLRELSRRMPHPLLTTFPFLKEIVDTCREGIISIEVRRGDLPTAASIPALALQSVPGMKDLFRLLIALGKTDFERGFHFIDSRQSVLSALIRVSYPVEEDTKESFARLAKDAHLAERRLVELAVYAPQWAGFVEYTLNWSKLTDAVFWVYAHTKDRQWSVDSEFRELWSSQISEYTPISADNLMDGAVDVAWFQQMYETLGEPRWKEVYRAAELTAGGSGHTRARIFADAMLGKTTTSELSERITKKRHQDAVRSLGLVPLPVEGDRQGEILRRYEVIHEFLRSSKKYGSQRQASEKLASAIALENLARNAGYSDPQRMEWALEIQAVADLLNGPITVELEGLTISFNINTLGEPELITTKNGKLLKSIPPKVKKDTEIVALLDRAQKLSRQTSRMRLSLEQAMCSGEAFNGQELSSLFQHPMLRAMLEQVVFIAPSGMGYPIEGGSSLYQVDGQQIPIAPEDTLHIAHPYDLLKSGEWSRWQHECFISERIQPFKQIFRELYVLTSAERKEQNLSRRYAGQQVNNRQALALFGARGWVVDPEEGVHKTVHDLGISARVGFLQSIYTPAEVEGLTLETILFTRRGEWKPILLEDIPSRVFSEVMRDVDLVVSVAHAGGVDPEASASSIEARTSLVSETCGLLGLQNVQVKNNHVLVSGKLGNYTIHLGSAVVHKQPGGALCIIPVHSQHRGRLFLPFIDNDPKTAEVISKVILLAKDHEIKDPTILEQIL